jgi:dolichyl-phosphate beta-glucosyltransferase
MSCDCCLWPIAVTASFVLLILLQKVLSKVIDGRPHISRSEREGTFEDPSTGERHAFPNLIQSTEDEKVDAASLYLSVIVPAYNEQDRLPVMLDETLEYLRRRLEQNEKLTFEVIVVDDGSKDATSDVVLDYSTRFGCDHVRLLRCDRNRGKGAAVRLGILSSRGERLLFADADGATKFSDIQLLEQFMDSAKQSEWAVAIGSRAHLQNKPIAVKRSTQTWSNGATRAKNDQGLRQRSLHSDTIETDGLNDTQVDSSAPEAERSAIRLFLMHGFHAVVYICAVRTVRDTQCGFKMFGRSAAVKLFNALHVTGWAFDVELLSLCEWLRLEVKEIPVNWTEVDGSKIVPVFSWMAMGRDVLTIAIMQTFGIWKRPHRQLN